MLTKAADPLTRHVGHLLNLPAVAGESFPSWALSLGRFLNADL
jgi:hypothetical protein